ncbi:MAG TPA: methyltransferase domain-containing protein [Ktedonobacterales bacterium]
MNEYLLDNAWQQQRERLAGLESWFDPGTIRHMETLGVAPGWRCLEVGGGGGSIALWLSRRVSPEGHVLATDLDTRFLDVLREPNLEVRRHNILTDPLPGQTFDLVHARFVVEHLADRMGALRHMASALKPGGWLLVEETDSSSWVPAPGNDANDNALFARWTTAYAQLLAATGADAYAGRRLYGELHTLGLTDIDAEGRVFMVRGGSSTAEVWRLTAEQVSDRIVASGLLTQAEMARVIALFADPAFVWMEGLIMAAWGLAR